MLGPLGRGKGLLNCMQKPPIPQEEAKRNIPFAIIMTILTCGIYDLYWNAQQMKTLNAFLRRNEFSFGKWLIFSLLTCGIYHVFYEYRMSQAIIELQKKLGRHVDPNLPLLAILLSLFGLSIVMDAIHQNEINEIFDHFESPPKSIQP